jgi:hypothetical protein
MADGKAMQDILDANPVFATKVTQFMMLHDAAEVLDELKPPHGDLVAAFLRETGSAVMQETGVGEEFIEAMTRARPPASWADINSHRRR